MAFRGFFPELWRSETVSGLTEVSENVRGLRRGFRASQFSEWFQEGFYKEFSEGFQRHFRRLESLAGFRGVVEEFWRVLRGF